MRSSRRQYTIFLPPCFSCPSSHPPTEYSSVIEMHIYMRLNAVDVRLKRAPVDEKRNSSGIDVRMRREEEYDERRIERIKCRCEVKEI